MAVRPHVQKPYDANLMKSTMSKEFATLEPGGGVSEAVLRSAAEGKGERSEDESRRAQDAGGDAYGLLGNLENRERNGTFGLAARVGDEAGISGWIKTRRGAAAF
jgi:hypothetical protein